MISLTNANQERIQFLTGNKFYEQELTLLSNKKLTRYYQHIIDNVSLKPENPNNSYVMWIFNKVEIIDTEKPAKIKPGSMAYPDIDMDFPCHAREDIIEYIVNKYTKDHVSHVATFSRMMGKSALSDVLNACGVDFKEAKRITKFVPNEALIADELEEMKKTGDSSLILWSLENKPELREWCTYENGEFSGPLATEFQQAIRLEGVKRSIGKHASAILLSKNNLDESVPMVYDKDGNLLSCEEYPDTESRGILKLDILGLDLLDKLEETQKLIREKYENHIKSGG